MLQYHKLVWQLKEVKEVKQLLVQGHDEELSQIQMQWTIRSGVTCMDMNVCMHCCGCVSEAPAGCPEMPNDPAAHPEALHEAQQLERQPGLLKLPGLRRQTRGA